MQKSVCQYLVPVSRNRWQEMYLLKKLTIVESSSSLVWTIFPMVEISAIIFMNIPSSQNHPYNPKRWNNYVFSKVPTEFILNIQETILQV